MFKCSKYQKIFLFPGHGDGRLVGGDQQKAEEVDTDIFLPLSSAKMVQWGNKEADLILIAAIWDCGEDLRGMALLSEWRKSSAVKLSIGSTTGCTITEKAPTTQREVVAATQRS